MGAARAGGDPGWLRGARGRSRWRAGRFLPHKHGARVRSVGTPRSASCESDSSARARRYALRGPTRPRYAEKSVRLQEPARSGDVLSSWVLPVSTCKNVPVLQVRQATRPVGRGQSPWPRSHARVRSSRHRDKANLGVPKNRTPVSCECGRKPHENHRLRPRARRRGQGVPPALAPPHCKQLRVRVRLPAPSASRAAPPRRGPSPPSRRCDPSGRPP